MTLFNGRQLIIATKHNKERVIAPPLEDALGVKCFVDHEFNTDSFGMFSGEVERKADPLSTARLKCLKAMALTNCDLGVASEGSFGSHPSLFFASADDEFLIFIDKKYDLEIVVRELSTETNFNGKLATSKEELIEFAEQAKFPTHGLILKPSKNNTLEVIKGITNKDKLLEAFQHIATKHGKAFVETDMRAMYNPSRMTVIAKATSKLVEKIKSCCPNCGTPGFGITDYKKGLPCNLCGLPTESTLSVLYQCKKCGHASEKMFPNGKETEDAMYCGFCNP